MAWKRRFSNGSDPDLLVLLKQILEFCSRESEKRKEDNQVEEQLNAIVAQIKRILETME